MAETVKQYDLLIRYLLGAASDTECRTVEEQFFASDDDLNVLLQAEDELIDDYVRGALSTSDQRLFESNFLCTNERRQRLEVVQSLVQVLAQTDFERSISSESFDRSLPLRERGTSRPRTSSKELALASFTELLHWLDPDRERAAEKYERIRSRLIMIFASRGFNNAEELVDLTFDRVAAKVHQLAKTYVDDPAKYFLGVARMVMREGARRPTHELLPVKMAGTDNVSDQRYSCLEKCLNQLSETDRDLVLQYFPSEKSKVAWRKQLAQSLGVTSNVLRMRVHRIRRELEACVRECLKGRSD